MNTLICLILTLAQAGPQSPDAPARPTTMRNLAEEREMERQRMERLRLEEEAKNAPPEVRQETREEQAERAQQQLDESLNNLSNELQKTREESPIVFFVVMLVFWGGVWVLSTSPFWLLGAWIGHQKQSALTGAVLGLFFGPLGTVITCFVDGRPKCPACGNRINRGAKICASCRSALA